MVCGCLFVIGLSEHPHNIIASFIPLVATHAKCGILGVFLDCRVLFYLAFGSRHRDKNVMNHQHHGRSPL